LAGWRFKQVFGDGVGEVTFALIHEELQLRKDMETCVPPGTFPYEKPGSKGPVKFTFSTRRLVPNNQVRSINYLAGAIGISVGSTPSLRSDIETQPLLDLDFVSFGGPESNLKTMDCQSNRGNRLAYFDQAKDLFLRISDRQPLVPFEKGFDYGLILKVIPAQFPDRVWISCAGRGEWGTSGAAWFLANKWKDLRERAGSKAFAATVRVRGLQDQSAELVDVITD
jgi:hypothetical protein